MSETKINVLHKQHSILMEEKTIFPIWAIGFSHMDPDFYLAYRGALENISTKINTDVQETYYGTTLSYSSEEEAKSYIANLIEQTVFSFYLIYMDGIFESKEDQERTRTYLTGITSDQIYLNSEVDRFIESEDCARCNDFIVSRLENDDGHFIVDITTI